MPNQEKYGFADNDLKYRFVQMLDRAIGDGLDAKPYLYVVEVKMLLEYWWYSGGFWMLYSR